MKASEREEWLACSASCMYFLHNYGFIYDATAREWVPFKLWPGQVRSLKTLIEQLLIIILKARQLGLTWLVLGYALWLMLFRPAATVLLFSKRDDEAVYLLGRERLRGMYERLPDWMRARAVLSDNDHEFLLSNGSVARAFPTTAGDSYTATLAIVDEADLVTNLGRLLNAVKPTIDAGGQMILLSRADKSSPESDFKRIYRAAKQKLNAWAAIFLGWAERPGRTQEWYEAQKQDVLTRTGSLDDLYQQYPATDSEALAPRSLDKRIPSEFLERCYREQAPIEPPGAPVIPGLTIYVEPQENRNYVIGADPAEGNPGSDDSSLHVLDEETGEEVAALAGKFQTTTFGSYIAEVSRYYNQALALVERNNHGHAVLNWLKDNSQVTLALGRDGKEGWQTNSVSKTLLYSEAVEVFRERETVIHSFATLTQLQSIDASTLSAPNNQHDDRAVSYVLAIKAQEAARVQVWI